VYVCNGELSFAFVFFVKHSASRHETYKFVVRPLISGN